MQWLDAADRTHSHSSYGNRTGAPLNSDGADAFSRRARTFNGASSSGKELTRESKRYNLSDDEESAASSDEDSSRHGGLGIRDGMSRIGAFFSNFTAPKGEGMGNPGPTSHPHLFPSRSKDEAKEEFRSPRRSPTATRSVRREATEAELEGLADLSLPPSAVSTAPAPAASKSGSSTPRVLLDIPTQDGPPVSPGSRAQP